MKKKEKKERMIVQSSQSFIPIRDIRNGVIITDDERYLKIIEFSPINFLLRSPIEQTSIIQSFAAMLKIAPCKLQFKSVSKKADTEKFLSILRRDYQNETNEKCHVLQKEYMKLVASVASAEGVSRRFFMVIAYEALVRNNDFNYISSTLNNTARAICNYMRQCGNEVLAISDDLQNDDVKQLSVLYDLLNRARAEAVPFERHYPQIVKRYIDYTKRSYNNPPFIPVTEFFSPKSIDFTHSKYTVVDGKYYTFAYIPTRSFNDSVYAGWLSFLVNAGEGIDVDVFFNKRDKNDTQYKINRQIRLKRSALNSTEDTNNDFDTLNDAIQAGFFLKSGLANEDLYYMTVLITIVGENEEDVEWKFRELNRMLVAYDMQLKPCYWQQEQAFLSVLPLCQLDSGIQKKGRRNVLTSTAASTYIFSSYEMCDEDGVLLGINQSNRSLAVVDFFNSRKYKNANISILGTSGAGKTFTLQCIATRMRMKQIQVFIIAPSKGHEFKRACSGIGGQFVNISAGSSQSINVMEIRKTDDTAHKLLDGNDDEESVLSKKCQQLLIFISLLVPDMNHEERQLIDEAVVRVYNQFGITNDNKSLFANGVGGAYKAMPILGDLHKILIEQPKTERIANILNLLVNGSAWEQVQTQGVYYTRQEMRGGYSNRMLGVLLTGDGWYVVYNTLGQMMKWNTEVEREDKEKLQKLFDSTMAYSGKEARAIVCAAGRSMVSTIVSGHKYGHNRSKKLLEFVTRTPYQQLLMNSHNLQGLYGRVYLVELNSAGMENLKKIVTWTREGEQAELVALAQANPEIFSLTTTVGATAATLYEISSGNRIVISHCYELISLYQQRNSAERYLYIGPKRQLDQTAKCLHDHLTSYIDIETGCSLEVPCYDEKGNEIRKKSC